MIKLAIKSNRILTPEGSKDGVVVIENAVIKMVVEAVPAGFDGPVFDAGNKILMPGVVDPHVHINEPGRTDWEGFETATKAAIAGGITMLADMPLNASPVTTSASAFDLKLDATKEQLYTNVGFWGGIIPGNFLEIEALIEKGVLGFKAFLSHSGIDEFPNVTEADLELAMPIIAKHSLPLLVHCELTDDVKRQTANVTSYPDYVATRPKEWEDNAIALMIRLCEKYNCPVHIVHLSSANCIAQIAAAKAKGLPLTVETAQHYLYFHAEGIQDAKTAFKCAPPIREKANNELLWQALKDGIIDFVATDHSPAPPDIKELKSGDFSKAWGGISSIQFALPALWTAARQRGFTMTDVVKWLCEKPALLAGQRTKGKIAPGFDADLVVLDDTLAFTVTEKNILHKHKVTPYLGENLLGVVKQTYLGGKLVYDRSQFTIAQGKTITARS